MVGTNEIRPLYDEALAMQVRRGFDADDAGGTAIALVPYVHLANLVDALAAAMRAAIALEEGGRLR